MKFAAVDRYLSAFKDWHLPISIGIFIVGSVIQWFHRLDASYVAFTATVLGAITGHAFSPAEKDTPADAVEDSKQDNAADAKEIPPVTSVKT